MEKEVRKSSIETIGDIPWGTHICQFCRTGQDLIEILIPYFKAGLENNEFCIWAISEPLRVEDAKEALKKAIPDFNIYLEKGQIEIIPYRCLYVNERAFDSERILNGWAGKLNQALASGYDGLRLVEDIFWLEKAGWSNFENYEKRMDSFISKHRIVVMHPCCLGKRSPDEIIDLISSHQISLIKKEGKWERIENSRRKNTEKMLRESEDRCKAFFESSIDAVLLTSPDGEIYAANPAACRVFGMSEEELIRVGRNEIVDTSDPRLQPALEERARAGRLRGELNFRRKDGTIFPGEISSALFTDKDGLLRSIIIIRDITERKKVDEALRESERRYHLLFENMFEGLAYCRMLYDDRGRPVDFIYLDTNSAFESLTGLKRVKGRRVTEIIPGIRELHPELFEAYGRVALTGKPERFETKFKPQGIWLSISVYSTEKEHFVAVFDNITGRKQEEHRVRRYNAVLEGINRIFSNIVRADTEEELANTCLSVALEITGSQIGFIGEIGTDGLLHDTAISDMGWSQCLMHDRAGHRRFSGRFAPYGLYGRLVDSRKSFFINDPQLHPDSTGLPEGHPPLTSFLAVPFILEGKIMGILAVANREGGYNREQQEDLEAIAPAVMQALQRKKIERERVQTGEALKEAYLNLEEKVKERTAELESAYNSLKENERSLAEAQSIAHIGNWDWDIINGKTFWSDELYRILGLNPQEFEMTHSKFLNYVHPDDREYVNNAVKKASGGEPYSIDFRVILAGGEERIIHAQGEAILNKKKLPVRMRGTVQDITERQKAEEKIKVLANTVESSNDGIITESPDGIITSWNKGAEQVYGYSAEEILGKNISILEPPVLTGETKKLAERIKQGEKIQQYETLRLRKDGKIIYVSITLSSVFDINGKLTAISIISRDITKRKEAEKALANLEIVRKKEIHHRIKNNLQVISSLLDLQAEKFGNRGCIKDSEVLAAFREIQDRVVSIALIHEELHEGEGTDTLNFSQYLQRLVENLFQTYRFGNSDISLNMDLEENVFFDMDIAVPLGMIVNELVSNSLKHAFPGGRAGEIRIKLSREEKGKCKNGRVESKNEECRSRYTLSVSDNGIGIPENMDLENTSTLGTQLVTALVDQVDGELKLKRDSGTEFVIKLAVVENQ